MGIQNCKERECVSCKLVGDTMDTMIYILIAASLLLSFMGLVIIFVLLLKELKDVWKG